MLWYKDIKSNRPIGFQEGICLLGILNYNQTKFKFCNTHLLRLTKCLQLLFRKLAIVNICLDQIWEAQDSPPCLCELVNNNRGWFSENILLKSVQSHSPQSSRFGTVNSSPLSSSSSKTSSQQC